MDQNQCSNKNDLMTIENKKQPDISENANAAKTQEDINRAITVLPRKCIKTQNQLQKLQL